MKGSTCLFTKEKNGDNVVLFETNQQLPFFWLMLVDATDIEIYERQLVSTKDEVLVLDKMKALFNAANRRSYIRDLFPLSLDLFDDWLLYIQKTNFMDMHIYLNLSHIVSAYNSAANLKEGLLKGVEVFDNHLESWYEMTIEATCGREIKNTSPKRFSDVSEAYQKIRRKDIYGGFEQMPARRRRIRKPRLLVFVAILLLLLSAVAYIIIQFML